MDQKPDKEKLKKYRAKVLRVLGKPELLELTEIKELLQELIKKEVVERKVITRETLPDLTLVKDLLKKILNKEPLKIEQKNIHLPSIWKTKVINFPKEPNKVEVTNQPKIDFLQPIKWLFTQIKSVFTPLFDKIITLLKEPDKTEITRSGYGYIKSVTDYYGKKKIIYNFERTDTDKIRTITRSER